MASSSLRVMANQPGWYGHKSGYYAQLPKALAEQGHHIQSVTPSRGLGWRVAGKAWSAICGLPNRRQTLTADEMRFHAGWLLRRHTIAAILAMEEHLPALSYWRKAPRRLVGTLHLPRAYWTRSQTELLARLQSALVLYRADLDFFASLVGRDRVRFVFHGVDTEFFRPATNRSAADRPTLLCVGQFGRDFEQLERAAPIVLDQIPDAELHLVIADFALASVTRLRQHPRVRLWSGISDDELRDLYQRSTVLFLPMEEAAANNAVVEALASGLPIVTTDVGGIRDYGGGTLFPVVPRGDDSALVDETVRLVRDESARFVVADDSRRFAVTHLSWPKVASDHWRAYCDLALAD